MDIGSFSRSDTATITIKDPFGKPTDISVELYGKDAKEYRKAVLEISREEAGTTEEAQIRRGGRIILAAVKSWENVEKDGDPLEPADALELMTDPAYEWFAEQIASAIYNRSLFFSRSGKS